MAPVARWMIILSVANRRVAGGPDEIVGYVALDVRSEVGPGLVCMVVLSITMGKYCVWREDGGSEGKHDGALDGCVGGAVVHLLVVGIKQCPCELVVGVLVPVLDEVC